MINRLALIALCVVLFAGSSTAWGATFGNTTGATYNFSIEGTIRGTQFELTEAGVATSITAKLTVGTVANGVRCMIYDGEDSSLVATTEYKIVPVQTATETTFNFNYTVNLAPGYYWLCAWGTTTAGTCFLGRNFSGTDTNMTDLEAMTSFPPDPYISTAAYNTTTSHIIYCTYTAGSQLVLGHTDIEGTSVSIKEQIAGGIFTTPSSAISVTGINAYVALQSAATEIDTMRCLVYKQSDLSYIDTTYQIKFYGDTAVSGALQMWRRFTFPTAKTLAASTAYVFAVQTGHLRSSANARVINVGGEGLETDDVQPFDTSPPDPLQDATLADRLMSVYADYTVIPSGTKPRRRKIMLGQPLGLVREATETFAGSVDAITR